MTDTAIWTVVIFLAMLFVLRSKAWGPILEGLQKREETIRSSLEEAKRTRDEMVKMQAKFQKELAEAHQQIPLLMEQARKKAEEMAAELRAKAVADIQTERERLRHEVEIAKDQAIKQMWEQAAQLGDLDLRQGDRPIAQRRRSSPPSRRGLAGNASGGTKLTACV